MIRFACDEKSKQMREEKGALGLKDRKGISVPVSCQSLGSHLVKVSSLIVVTKFHN